MDLRDYLTPAAERSASTPEMVAAVLREAILAGALAPRQPVRQDGVAAHLGISKIPVREALRRLEAEGLVVFHPNRGVTVAPLSASESREIVEMRVALETLALRHAVPALGARDLRRAEARAAELEHEDDPARRSALNWDFHACLYGPGARPLLLDAVRGLHLRFDRYMRLVLSTLHHHPQSQREHRDLLAACAARDVPGAVAVLTAHIETAGTRVSDHLTALSQAEAPAGEGAEGDA